MTSLPVQRPMILRSAHAESAVGAPHGAPTADAAPVVSQALGHQVSVLLLADFAEGSRLWGWGRMVRGPGALRGVPGLRFAKLLGCGFEGGFGLRPSLSRQGLFAVFDDEAAADAFIDHSRQVDSYRKTTRELCVLKLRAWSCRGSWDGRALEVAARAPMDGPVAALTRASIRLPRALEFWRKAPPAQCALEAAPGCQLAAGLGEAPLLRQATFSIWDSVQAMDAYARSGAHLEAIRAARAGDYFSESMFARFVPVAVRGVWKGRAHG